MDILHQLASPHVDNADENATTLAVNSGADVDKTIDSLHATAIASGTFADDGAIDSINAATDSLDAMVKACEAVGASGNHGAVSDGAADLQKTMGDRVGASYVCASSGTPPPPSKFAGRQRRWIDTGCLVREISIILVAFLVSIAVVSVMRPYAPAAPTEPTKPAFATIYYMPKRGATVATATATPTPSPKPCWCRFSDDSNEGMSTGHLVGTDCVCQVAAKPSQQSSDTTDQATPRVKAVLALLLFLLALAILMEVSNCNPM
ncbi:hypothetical protein psal_cds_1159 [Pandoravirus salinus]|uniref:Uncharacterized protein n=1 Tax=Pandoravirus salinus TaxID=1349410 RepID=S4W516_9VIRU|nr:hypothetical protein psal_cds_1159 [Pandoravirus salinus]AGO85430.1 hypothetical protein psal_cds_1159 [Pandoravirus salinus]